MDNYITLNSTGFNSTISSIYDVGYKVNASVKETPKETPEERNKRLRELVKKVILNGDVTVILWNDGTKTVVRRDKNDVYDPEKAILACMAKKLYENTGIFNEAIEDAMEKYSFPDKILMQRLIESQQHIKHLKKQLRKMKNDNKE